MPRRQVIEHPQGWQVSGSDFHTSDRSLAAAVAARLDRIDPLPCSEHGDWIEITTLDSRDRQMMCARCGKIHIVER